MPNLFVIGAAKSGTSSLHSYLDQHPEISMSRVKEPGYFLESNKKESLWITDRAKYLALFEPGHRIRGDSTVAYSTYPSVRGVPQRIAAEVPEARLIYLVRDPIDRIPAMLRQGIATGSIHPQDPSIPISVRDWIGDLRTEDNRFLQGGKYMTQIRQFLSFFPKESVLVVDSDELRNRRAETMEDIFRFLGCTPDVTLLDLDRQENVGDDLTYKPAFYRWLRRRKRLRRWYRQRPDSEREALGGRLAAALGKPIPEPVIDAELRRDLEDIFRPEVQQLREFTGEDFSGWSV